MMKLSKIGLWALLGLLLASWVFYWGYCWGWWLKGNQVTALLLQCHCPAASEPARHPDTVEVVISACRDPELEVVSPDGRQMVYQVNQPRHMTLLRYLPTGSEWNLPDRGQLFRWLNNRLLYVKTSQPGYFLIDTNHKSAIPLANLQDVEGAVTYADKQLTISPEYVEFYRNADFVYLFQKAEVVIALDQAPDGSVERSSLLHRWDFVGYGIQDVVRALGDYGIRYIDMDSQWPVVGGGSIMGDVYSHNGRFYANATIIHTADGSRVTETEGFYIYGTAGWAYDDSGVYYWPGPVFLVGGGFQTLVPPFLFVGQPILKLKVPPAYLSPGALHVEQARQAQQRAAATQAATTFWIVVAITVGAMTLGVVWQRTKNRSIGSGQRQP